MKKLLTWLIEFALVLSMMVPAVASGEVSGEASGNAVTDSGPKATIVLTDGGEDKTQEQTGNFQLTFFPSGGQSAKGLSGFLFTSPASDSALLFSELTADTGTFYTIGGQNKNVAMSEYPVTQAAAEHLSSLGITAFDSAVVLGDNELANSCPPVISAKGYTYLDINGTLVLAEGAARSAIYSDVSGGTTVPGPPTGAQGSETPIVIVRRSLLETIGGTKSADSEESFSVLSTGSRARGIQPQGKSIVYLYDSAVVSHTWGAWSTDSARGELDLVAYRSLGLSQNGYGAYADTNCHLYLYGSEVRGGSDGIVASNNGEIYAVASDSADTSTSLRTLMGKTASDRNLSWRDQVESKSTDSDETVRESVIMGGQSAVQFHMPDMGHSGAGNSQKATFYMDGGTLATSVSLLGDNGLQSLNSSEAYTRRYAGACIVTKSTQVNACLNGVTMNSWNGELIHTMINSDSNVNDIADGDEAPGSDIRFLNMDVTGDIVHDDYQRTLRLVLSNTTLNGAIYSNTCEDWNKLCRTEFDGENILNPDGYNSRWGVVVYLTDGSIWNVTDTSVVQDIKVINGTVNGVITQNADGTFTISPLSTTEPSGEAF